MWISVDDKLPEWNSKVEVLCVDESRNVYIGPAYYRMYSGKNEWLDILMMPFSERGITVKYWRRMNEWISVKDRLPQIGKNVLIYYPKWDGDEIQVAKLEDDGMMFDICDEFNIGTGGVSHWMPLPEPPESEDDAE